MNGVEPPVSLPVASSSGSNENLPTDAAPLKTTGNEIEPQALYGHQMIDASTSQDCVGGMMKIVPSEVDVSAVFLSNFFYSYLFFNYQESVDAEA